MASANTSFAIRGGGHSPLPGWASIDDGVLIVLTDINELEYQPSSETVRVGFGNTWQNIYRYLEPYQRAVVGGRVPDVGLGLLTGGGLSHHSSLYGFASDNVVSYELVLANGTKTTVTSSSNKDLFWALKAGSNNFGVLTHATLKTYPQGMAWGGMIAYDRQHVSKVMGAIADYQARGQLDPKSALLPYIALNNLNAISISFVYLDAIERPAAFDPFYSIPRLLDTTKIHDSFASAISGTANVRLPRITWGTTTFYLDHATYVEVAQLCQNITQRTDFRAIKQATMVLTPQPISKAMVEASRDRGESALTLRAREQVWLLVNLGWVDPADDQKMNQILEETIRLIEKLVKDKGLYDEYIFLNNAHSSQALLRSYGMNEFRKLKRVSREVDPLQMFQTLVPGGFKIKE